jgi:hypothetical protein
MYAKVFSQIFDSSLRDKWQAWVVFVALLVLADENDEVDMTVEALKARTGLPGTIVPEGLAFLEAPDEHSRSPEYEGRRIVRLDEHRPWGWKIVNRGKYKRIRDQSERRDYFREQKRKERQKEYEAQHGCPPQSTTVHQCQPQAVGSRQETEKEESTPSQRREKTVAASPTVMEMPLRDGSHFAVTEADIAKWRKFYPEVDIPLTLREQVAWLESNPGRKKTRRGMPRFINAWFLKEQEKPYDEAPARNGYTRR